MKEDYKMDEWQYRVIKSKEGTFSVQEVYFDEDGKHDYSVGTIEFLYKDRKFYFWMNHWVLLIKNYGMKCKLN